jgi:hypothetical protein
MEVHAFLKEYGVFPHYTYEDFLHDREAVSVVARS